MRLLSTPQEAAAWLRAHVTGALHTDSRKIAAGDGFIAWPGAATDGRQYVLKSMLAGAVTALVEHEDAGAFGFADERIACYAGLKAASGLIAAEYFVQPSKSIDVIAITGTNGKTSTAWWLAQAINMLRGNSLSNSEHTAQYFCGLMGTLGLGTPGKMVSTGLTTPDPVMLQSELARLRDTGASACAMEASSIGIAEHRMTGTQIRVAVFTNFTQDHLDYHSTMHQYWLAKRTLFEWPLLQVAVINVDDPKGQELVALCAERGLQVITTSQHSLAASLYASPVVYASQGMRFEVQEAAHRVSVSCPVVGDYNAANLLGVIGALRALGVNLKDAANAIAQCTAVPGRMELIGGQQQPLAVVDYAHTPDALAKAVQALRPVSNTRGGQLWCVFGCGGNRDASKRPLMAQAAQAADHIVVTSDNPRFEKPEDIAAQTMAGLTQPAQSQLILARAQAITQSIKRARAADVLLIAGKGHEDYQEIAGIKHPFSDQEVVREALSQWVEETV
jgi:UDP-N-acetylmuramyl-tripeptide synthetase